MLWLQRALEQHFTNTVMWNLQSHLCKPMETGVASWKNKVANKVTCLFHASELTELDILTFFWLGLDIFHGDKPKGQWGESLSFLCIAPTVKHLSCGCKSPDNQPELTLLEIFHGTQRTQVSTSTRNHFSPKSLLVLQEPVKNEQMLLLPFDFSGWKHILSNVFQWHHLRILAVLVEGDEQRDIQSFPWNYIQ